MASRASTSLRLGPKGRALIAKAAAALGDDVGAFIRCAARDRAEQVLADVEYRHFMEQKNRQAAGSRKVTPALSPAK